MMSALLYYGIIKPISLLPYRGLYILSDFVFVVLYRIIGYRKKVVGSNLKRSFPEKSDAELKDIERAFYRHFCDVILESLKNFSVKESSLRARFKHHGSEVFEQLAKEGKQVILAGGHYANWEMWALSASPYFSQRLMAIYKRLSNPYFDRKMRETRGKYGLELVSTRETGDWLEAHKEELFVSVFAIDQSPSNPRKALWIDFLGQETAALFGTEKYAVEYNMAIVFGHLRKEGRGQYAIEYELITKEPRTFAHGDLTRMLHAKLEADIRREPRYWLWTHKRWKHKRPSD
ncbi:MAG: lysophospholipid acyltransferase family protein [Flavobacteriales bacterium]|jgi:KDO2-lipid IV(A) lauroyltransferase